MRRGRRARSLLLAALLVLVGGAPALSPIANAAETPSPFEEVDPNAPVAPTAAATQQAPPPDGEVLPSAVINPSTAKPGTAVRVFGSNWPSSGQVSATTCGNNGIGGSEVCSDVGGATFQVDGQGSFGGSMTLRKPPRNCPCVVHLTSIQTVQTVDLPVTLTGVPTSPVVNTTVDSRVSTQARIKGGGPVLWSWFGGSAKRTVSVTLNNQGADQIDNVVINLAVGKGADPTDFTTEQTVGTLVAGGSVTVDLPVKINAPAFGTYTAKVTLENVVSTTGPVRVSTSAYPWALFVLAWLVLQPLLLGLYKRRPVVVDGDSEDPISGRSRGPSPVPVAAAAVAVAATANGAGGGSSLDEEFGPFVPAGPSSYAPAAPAGYLVPAPTRALVPNYRPVFGVNDLRTYLDPSAHAVPQTAAPRIVIGGLVPGVPAPDPVPYDQNGQPVDQSWPTAAEQNGHGQL